MPPAKAIKTERTHEENQERAYIAASRRSDRSLEARVESARRASEIHKRRTGRSLRVTEQDVINEEMYEEEDDDLPMQYRRLAAHLTTNNADFNRRLNDYLTTHIAMRSALANSYGQQFPMPQQNTSMFPSPMLAHQQQQPQQQQPAMQPSMQPSMHPSGSSTYRQQPYPSPHQKALANQHHRSLSIATVTPQEYSTQARGNQSNDRRFSTPATPATMSSMTINSPMSAATDRRRPSFPQGSFAQFAQPQQQSPDDIFSSYNHGINPVHSGQSYSAFSTALPAESQMFLGSTLDFEDPLSSMFMAGADQNQIYDFSAQLPPTLEASKHQPYPSFDGLNSTLAPATSQDNLEDATQHVAQDSTLSFFDQALGNTPSGTPGVNGESWGNFINTEQWNTPTSSQQ